MKLPKTIMQCGWLAATAFLFTVSALAEYKATFEQGQYYYYMEAGNDKKISAWVPYADGRVVRGLIIDGNAGNGNNITGVQNEYLQAFARQFGFGLVASGGLSGSQTYDTNAALFLAALDAFAAMGYNPELANAPFITHGSSSAGANAYGLAMKVPERTICFTANVAAGFNPKIASDAGVNVPGIVTLGDVDQIVPNNRADARIVMPAARARGALWAWMDIQGMGHETRRVYCIFFRYWEKMIAARLPADANPRNGPVQLLPLSEKDGWLADNNTWNNSMTEIYPYSNQTSWLPDEELAMLYRSYSSWNQLLTLNIAGVPDYDPDNGMHLGWFEPGDSITLECDASNFPNWTSIEFFRGNTKIGEVTEGTPNLTITLGDDSKVQAFTVLGHDATGLTTTAILQSIFVMPKVNWIQVRDLNLVYTKYAPWYFQADIGWFYLFSGDIKLVTDLVYYRSADGDIYYTRAFVYPSVYNFTIGEWQTVSGQ